MVYLQSSAKTGLEELYFMVSQWCLCEGASLSRTCYSSPSCKHIITVFPLVPGSDERKLHKSISVGADCIVYDLEDSVAASKKGTARQMIMDALEASEHGKAEKAVRINAVGSGKDK
jgi:hypothetical protein